MSKSSAFSRTIAVMLAVTLTMSSFTGYAGAFPLESAATGDAPVAQAVDEGTSTEEPADEVAGAAIAPAAEEPAEVPASPAEEPTAPAAPAVVAEPTEPTTEQIAAATQGEIMPMETGGYGLITNTSEIIANNGSNKFANSQHAGGIFECAKDAAVNMNLQFAFPTGATEKRIEVTLPTELEWRSSGGETAQNNGLISSYSGPTDLQSITKGLGFSCTTRNGKYVYSVKDDVSQLSIKALINAYTGIYGDETTNPQGQLFTNDIKVETFYKYTGDTSAVLKDTAYSGDFRVVHENGNHGVSAIAANIAYRYYQGLDKVVSMSTYTDLGFFHRDHNASVLLASDLTFTLTPDALVNEAGGVIIGTGNLNQIKIENVHTDPRWTSTGQDSSTGAVTIGYTDYNYDYFVPNLAITVPASSGIQPGSIIRFRVDDASVRYYNGVERPYNDTYFYLQVLDPNEDCFVNFERLMSSDKAKPEDDGTQSFLNAIEFSPSFGNREGTTSKLGAFTFGNRGGSDSVAKTVEMTFDTTNVSIKAAGIGLPYAATSSTNLANRAPVGNGGVIQAWAVDADGNVLNGGNPYTYTLPAQYQNLSSETQVYVSNNDFGIPDDASISKMSYELTTIPSGDLIPASTSFTGDWLTNTGLAYFGSIKNVGVASKSYIEVKDSVGTAHTTGKGGFKSNLGTGMGCLGANDNGTEEVQAGSSKTRIAYFGTAGSFSGVGTDAFASGVTTNPVMYLRNAMVAKQGLIDVDSIVVNDIYGNPMVKDTDYTVTTSTDASGAQVVKIDTAGVTDNRASLMSFWTGKINDSTRGNPLAFESSVAVSYSYKADYLAEDDHELYSDMYFVADPNATIGVVSNTTFAQKGDPYNLDDEASDDCVVRENPNYFNTQLSIKSVQDLVVASAGKLTTETNYRPAYDGSNPVLLSPSQTLDFKTSFINTSGLNNTVKSARAYIPILKVGDNWGKLQLDADGKTPVTTTFDLAPKSEMVNPDDTKYEIYYGKVTPSDDGSTLDGYFAANQFEVWNDAHADDYNCITIRLKDNKDIPFVDVPGGTPEEILAANTTDFVIKMGLSAANMPAIDNTDVIVYHPYFFRQVKVGEAVNERFSEGAPLGVSTSSVKFDLKAKKTLSGQKGNTDIAADQFKFGVSLTSGSASTVSGLPAADVGCKAGTTTGAEVDFGTITINDLGTYVLKIEETGTAPAGYTFDTKPVTATVKVVNDVNTGALSIDSITYSKDGATVTSPTFANTFNPTPGALAAPAAVKAFSSDSAARPAAKTFSFSLKGDAGTEPMPAGTAVGATTTKTYSGTAGGTAAAFGDISYDTAGTYVYRITETAGSDASYTYDKSEYTWTVTVTGTATLSAAGVLTKTKDASGSAITPVAATAPTFTNKYMPAATTATDSPSVTKEVTANTPSEASTFNFSIAAGANNPVAGLLGMNATASITTDTTKTEAKPFGQAVFTKAGIYTFAITETAGTDTHYAYDGSEYTWTVEVKDNNGQLVVDSAGTKIEKTKEKTRAGVAPSPQAEVKFENAYTPVASSWTPTVTKTVSGEVVPAGKEETFTFKLTGTGIAAAGVTKTVKGAGGVSFDAINYTKAGTYTYQIAEVAGTNAGYTYDASVYDIKVVVTDNKGTLSAVADVTKAGTKADAITFDNVYKPSGTIDTEDIDGNGAALFTKVIAGTNVPAGKQFDFTLHETTAGATLADKTASYTTTAGDTGSHNVGFGTITYTKAGTYTYEITETTADGAGWTKSGSPAAVTVTVTDEDGNGTLKVATSPVSITNTYAAAPAIVKIDPPITKTIAGDKPDSASTFNFKVVGNNSAPMPADATGAEVERSITGEGSVEIGEITYSTPGTYTYDISEVAGSTKGYTYDDAAYVLTVTITDKGDGTLGSTQSLVKAGATDEVTAAAFTNNYTAPVTPSGDVEVVKTGDKATVKVGDEIDYSITVTNKSTTASATGVWVKDYMPAGTEFVSCAGDQKGDVATDKTYVNWFFDTLAPSESKTITMKVKVANLKIGDTVTNTALYEVTGKTKDEIDFTTDPSGKKQVVSPTEVSDKTTPATTKAASTTAAKSATSAKTGDTLPLLPLGMAAVAAAAVALFTKRKWRSR